MRMLCLVFCLLGGNAFAGSFESYYWRLGFLQAQGYYQLTLKMTYEYNAEGGFDPAVLALPNDENLKIQSLEFKVDGNKVEPLESEQTPYWSYGKSVNTWLPSQEGKKIKATALYIVKNLFLIPPAPTNLPVAVDHLNVGFAPIYGFDIKVAFLGSTYPFDTLKIPARPGDATRAYVIKRKKVPAAENQEFLFLIPKTFNFSFGAMSAAQWEPVGRAISAGNGSGGALQAANSDDLDRDAGQRAFSITGDLKAYSAHFYMGDPARDWQFALTWLQLDRTYLPHGVDPSGGTKSRSLFKGAGEKTDDLLSWYDVAKVTKGDAAPELSEGKKEGAAPLVDEIKDKLSQIDLFLRDYRKSLKINLKGSHLVATIGEDGTMSPAYANRALTNELIERFQVNAVPSLVSPFPQDRIAALPLSAFESIITSVKLGKNWFFVDAANPAWQISDSLPYLKGHSVVILEEGDFKLGGF